MRSHLVYSAVVRTPNRYLLCRVISIASRILLRRNGSFPASINSCLESAAKPIAERQGALTS